MTSTRRDIAVGLGAAAFAAGTRSARAAETLKVGALRLASSGPVFMAQDLGYFGDAGLAVEFRMFEAAQPVAVATVSGDVDLGVTGITAGFYNLAGKGALKVIAGQAREEPGYRLVAVVASRKAAEAGLTSLDQLPGRAAAVTQVGSTFHYSLGLLAEKHGFPISRVRIVPMQSIPNVVSAVKGGQVDAAIMPATAATPLIETGDAKLIGWADETPWQVAAVFTTPKAIANRRSVLEGFVKAYRRALADYHAAFLQRSPDGKPALGPRADEFIAIVAKYTGQSPVNVRASLPFIDADARLMVNDIYRQVRWYQSEKLVDAAVDPKAVVDLGFVESADGPPASMRLVVEVAAHAYDALPVLDDVAFAVEAGEVVAIVGPSGCGKSTLLGIVGGLIRPTRGRIETVGALPAGTLNAFTYVFQDFALLPWRSVAANVALPLEHRAVSRVERERLVHDALTRTGLADFAAALPKQLSGGMRQRVGIARALVVRPAVLLLDEPLSALDAQTRELLMEDFGRLWIDGRTAALYVTHNLDEAIRLADRIVVLSRRPGRIKEIVTVPIPRAERNAPAAAPARHALHDRLWGLIRDEAASADREVAHA